MEGCCKHGNEHSVSIKCDTFLDQLTDTIPVNSASANVSFYTTSNNSKMPNFEL